MITLGLLIALFVLLVVGIFLSVRAALRHSSPAMGLLAFLLLCVASGVVTKMLETSAQLDKIELKKE